MQTRCTSRVAGHLFVQRQRVAMKAVGLDEICTQHRDATNTVEQERNPLLIAEPAVERQALPVVLLRLVVVPTMK